MSDESSITVSALLAPLTPINATALGQTGGLNDATFQASADTDKQSFSSILASNIDADSGSNETGDELDGAQKPRSNRLGTTKTELLSTDENFELAIRSSTYLPHNEAKLTRPIGGKIQSSDGNSLPIQGAASGSAENPLNSLSQDFDAVDTPHLLAGQLSTDSATSETTLDETLDAKNSQDLLALGEDPLSEAREAASIPPNFTSVPATNGSAASANHSIESAGVRAHVDGKGVAMNPSSSTDRKNLLDQQTATSDGASTEGESLERASQDNAKDRVLETRLGERMIAKFSHDREFAPDQTLPASTHSRTGESLLNTLSSLNTLSALGGGTTSPLTTSATATLPPSLYSASPTERGVASQQIAQQISSFVSAGNDYAEINLSPPHLGKITVRIALQNDQASVLLSAPTPEIRELLESSLPKLSALLSEAGLSLSDSQVSDHSKDESSSNTLGEQTSDNQSADTHTGGEATHSKEALSGLLDQHNGRTLFDAYA